MPKSSNCPFFLHPQRFLFCMILPVVIAFAETNVCEKHPQQQVCDDDVVIKAKILSREIDEDFLLNTCRAYYSVDIISIFKGIHVTQGRQFFRRAREGCDENDGLDIGNEYLITALEVEDGLLIEACQWVKRWESLTRIQQQYLTNHVYVDNCGHCQISRDLVRSNFDQQVLSALGTTCFFQGETETKSKNESCIRYSTRRPSCAWAKINL